MNKELFNIKLFVSVIAGVATFWFLNNPTLPTSTVSFQQTPEAGEMIVVSFSSPISKNNALKSFSISPAIKGELRWLDEYNELRFLPINGFDSNKSYTVSIDRSNPLFAQLASNVTKKTFQQKGLPTKFNARIPGDSTIYYITESGLKRPTTLEVFKSYPDNKEADIRIIDKWALELYPNNVLIRLNEDSSVYKLENGIKRHVQNIETFDAMGFDWDSITTVNQFEFDSYLNGEPISIGILSSEQKPSGKFIDVNLETMKATMWQDGKIVDEVPVAGTGNPVTSPTRKGFFSVISKEPNHFSSLSRVWMPWSVRYSGDYYLHGWPYWPNGTRLTSLYSSGCVRLDDDAAKKIYDFSEIGTHVNIR